MTVITAFVKWLEGVEFFDRPAKPLMRLVSRMVAPRLVRNVLSGTYLGHPAHPMLTDVPIGAWTTSVLLDTVGGRASEPAADLLVGAGVVAAVPTALSGLNDWSDTYGPESRLGFVHAVGNTVTLLLYGSSFAARKLGRRRAGRALGLAGFATMVGSAYLGGHLSFGKGVNVNQTAFEHRPSEWTAVAADRDLGDGSTIKVTAAGAAVLLYRRDGRIYALANTCSHMGGPLDEGKVDDGCVTCPWHGSTFRLSDGKIVRGPASSAQPVYETRVQQGRIEVRARG